MGRKPKATVVPPASRINLEDDFVFVVQARTAGGLIATIAVHPTEELAKRDRDAFLATRKGSRYWVNTQGEIEIWIQTKLATRDVT
jgi:hypothetical protein